MYNANNSRPTVTNCTFAGNVSDAYGGGMFNWDTSSPTVENCIFSGNISGYGGGIYDVSLNSIVTNCTFSGNTADFGGGMYVQSSPSLANCIFWGNTDNGGTIESGQIHVADGFPVVSYSDVQGGWTGSGGNNINADPLFVDADGEDEVVGTEDDDLRLSAGSPCIDAGISIAGISRDLDGNARLADDLATANTGLGSPPIDMGAYEFGSGVPLVPADLDKDGDVDGVDFAQFAACFNKAGNPPRTLGCPEN